MERIVMGFRGMRLVLHVSRLSGMEITYEILSEYLTAVRSQGLKE
jgi:hypothetical protein